MITTSYFTSTSILCANVLTASGSRKALPYYQFSMAYLCKSAPLYATYVCRRALLLARSDR
jgi:hypothetical protein